MCRDKGSAAEIKYSGLSIELGVWALTEHQWSALIGERRRKGYRTPGMLSASACHLARTAARG
jgi:hypothetical protein